MNVIKGLQRLVATIRPGGQAIDSNFGVLGDRIGPCKYDATVDPTINDDSAHGYYVGSRWINTSTGKIFECLSEAAGAAIWVLGGWIGFKGLGQVPVGAIIAFPKSYTNIPALPSEWVECNGQTLSDSASVFNGQVIPDLNTGTQRFLRGSSTSGAIGGSETHNHTICTTSICIGTGDPVTVSNAEVTDFSSTLPSYYEVTWIMRIK